MARFYGALQGNRGEASRLGSAASGLHGHIRGWNLGGEVYMSADGDRDSVRVALTSGSHRRTDAGIDIEATEQTDGRVRFVVSLPGGWEARGYVGDPEVEFVRTGADA